MRRVARIFGIGIVAIALIIGAAILVLRTPDTDAVAMRAKYGGPPSSFVDLGGGLTVHVRDTGPRDAPVLMLLHGSNASLHTWEPWANRLDKRWRVIRYDQPGHGLTGPNPTHDYSARGFVVVLDRLRAKLGIKRFALAGNSMGGGIAWHYALAHPERVSALILVDASGQPNPADRKAPPFAFRVAQTPVLRDLATIITPRSLIAGSLPDGYANRALATDDKIDLYWELLRYPGNRRATVERFATPGDPGTPEKLHALAMPVLILWGAQDRLIPVSSARWFAQQIPQSKLIIYPDAGHIPMEEVADRSAAAVAAFLETVPEARPAH